jgi:HK97 family phage prohead protease
MKKENGAIVLEYKSVPFEMQEMKLVEIDGVKCHKFKGYLSTFDNIDLGDDVCAKGCFAESLKVRQPKLMWQHGRDNTKVPLGVFPVAVEDEKGLYVEGAMPEDDTFVSGRIVPQMKIKSIDTMSIGYDTIDCELMKSEDRTIRILKKVDLWEGSLVTFAMNPLAMVTDNVKEMIAQFKNIGDISRFLKNFFTVKEANDIIFSIKKFQSCKENEIPAPDAPCNEEATALMKSYVESLKLLTKENKNAGTINT